MLFYDFPAAAPVCLKLRGDSLLVSDGGGSDIFRFVQRCLVCLWVRYLVRDQYIFGVADEKI